MSRSGYTDDWDGDNWQMIMANGAYQKAVKGKRGQAFLREALAVLEAMETKELVEDTLQEDGAYCVLGAVGAARGLNLDEINTNNYPQLSQVFNISKTLARQLMHENDEWVEWRVGMTPAEERHKRWLAVHRYLSMSIRN